MKSIKVLSAVALFSLFTSAHAASTTYGGVTFPAGDISFADEVINYSPGTDVGSGWNDSSDALGAPNSDAVSLGDGGSLTVKFTNNSLIASGDSSLDLWIFEIGGVTEYFDVFISTNGTDWLGLGSVRGQPTGIDIDAISGIQIGVPYSFVKLIDDESFNQTGSPYGEADIDAIGAISSAPPVSEVPIPAAAFMFAPALLGFMGLRRKVKQAA